AGRVRSACGAASAVDRRPHHVVLEGRGAIFEAPGMKVSLVSRFPLGRQGDGVAAEFVLNPGETTTFILRQVEENGHDSVHDGVLLEARLVGTEALTQTLAFWRQWLRRCNYSGRWR